MGNRANVFFYVKCRPVQICLQLTKKPQSTLRLADRSVDRGFGETIGLGQDFSGVFGVGQKNLCRSYASDFLLRWQTRRKQLRQDSAEEDKTNHSETP